MRHARLPKLPAALFGATLAAITFASAPTVAWGHCDTLDGPVVLAGKEALESREVTPALKWVQKGDEAEIRAAFDKALAVRGKGPEAKELADRYFYETLVRVHRAGEGQPYTGLKPAGAVDPGIKAADEALASGSAEALKRELAEAVSRGVEGRFEKARDTARQAQADKSVEAGRQAVAAYVQFIHYVEGLHTAATSGGAHGAGEGNGHAAKEAAAGGTPHHEH